MTLPTSLRTQLFGLLIGASILLAAMYALLINAAYTARNQWLLTALIVFIGHAVIIWRSADQNRATLDDPILPAFGIANIISMLRGVLNCMLAGFFLAPFPDALPWLLAIIWTISALADAADGLVARVLKQHTLLGGTLDMEFDTLGLLIAGLLGVWFEKIPAWYLILVTARYLFIAGIWWRQRNGKPVYDLTDSHNRRLAAGLQMAFLTVILWPNVKPPYTVVAAYAFGIPFAIIFLRDWLVVSGRIDPNRERYQAFHFWARAAAHRWIPLYARLFVVYLLLNQIIPLDWSRPITWLWVAGVVMVAFGLVARVGSVFLIATAVYAEGPLEIRLILLVSAVMLLFFGNGPYTIWLPDEPIFSRRLG